MMTYKYPHLARNVEARDTLIFGEVNPKAYRGGIRYFDGLSLSALHELFAKGFIDANDRQNDAPAASQILAFMERYPDYTAHGYAVTLDRTDYRVTLEGVTKGAPADSIDELEDFTTLFKDADTLNSAIMDCWFD